jgi:hypothetical protein
MKQFQKSHWWKNKTLEAIKDSTPSSRWQTWMLINDTQSVMSLVACQVLSDSDGVQTSMLVQSCVCSNSQYLQSSI